MSHESEQRRNAVSERYALVQKVAGPQLSAMHEAFSSELGRRWEFVSTHYGHADAQLKQGAVEAFTTQVVEFVIGVTEKKDITDEAYQAELSVIKEKTSADAKYITACEKIADFLFALQNEPQLKQMSFDEKLYYVLATAFSVGDEITIDPQVN